MGDPEVETGPFIETIDKYLIKFGDDADGKRRQPPKIPLYCLLGMQMIRSLQVNMMAIDNLKAKFKMHSYVEEQFIFYVQPTDEDGNTNRVTNVICQNWGPLWIEENRMFEAECDQHAAFACLKDKIFSMFDGNHRLFAWRAICDEFPVEPKYDPRIRAKIFIGIKDSYIELEAAMHAINQYVHSPISQP